MLSKQIRGCSSRSFYRNLSILPAIDVSNRSLPTVTGRGPFVDFLTFMPMGNTSAVLSVQLPESSSLNLRTTSIVALNGIVEDIQSDFRSLAPQFWYQSVSLRSAATIIVSCPELNYHVVTVNKNEIWNIKSAESLIAWTGYDLLLTSSDSKKFAKLFLRCEGVGSVVIKSSGKLFEVHVEEGEQIIVSLSALVASNVPLTQPSDIPITRPINALLASSSTNPSKIIDFMKRALNSSLQILRGTYERYGPKFNSIPGVVEFPSSILLSIKVSLQRIWSVSRWNPLYGATTFYTVTGPAKILIEDKPQVSSQI